MASTATRGRRPGSGMRASPGAPLDLLDLHDGLALVVAAMGADPVRELGLVAVRAQAGARGLAVVVGAPAVAAGLRVTALGIRHRGSLAGSSFPRRQAGGTRVGAVTSRSRPGASRGPPAADRSRTAVGTSTAPCSGWRRRPDTALGSPRGRDA